MIVLVTLFVAAIVAMGLSFKYHSLEYWSYVLFAAGMIVGIWQDRRDTQRRAARETHRRLVDELRRHG